MSFIAQETRGEKEENVHGTFDYLIFKAQSSKEEVLLHVSQLVIETVRIPLEDVTGLITKPYSTFKNCDTYMLQPSSESHVENAPPLPGSQLCDALRPPLCTPPLIPINLSENEGQL